MYREDTAIAFSEETNRPESGDWKSLNLYCRSVSIDFERMRVIEKSLKVRRLDDGNTEWAWYVILSSKWTKYGEQVYN